jgi:chemotaxis protein CheZ
LFIKLRFIFNERGRVMVNDPCSARRGRTAARRERGIKAANLRVVPGKSKVQSVSAMAGPRKIFRIEQSAASRYAAAAGDTQADLRHAELMQEIAALRALVAVAQSAAGNAAAEPETDRLTSELNLIHEAISGEAQDGAAGAAQDGSSMSRVALELQAVVDTAEQATQKILAAAEEIDQAANNLSAALKDRLEQGQAQDIRDSVLKIFEACNFQDLAGQRVAKVMATLTFIENHVMRLLEEIKHAPSVLRRNGSQDLHGPRLDFDDGHASQDDIDVMFADD